MPRLRMLGIAERQRVEAGDRPRAHGEHVAQDAADAGGGALIGLDIARVVVALHLEHASQAVADVDDAGVLARALDHPRALGRQRAQMDLGRLVRAVLVPHRRKDAELGQRSARARSDSRMRSYSSGLRPCSATSSGVMRGSLGITVSSVMAEACLGHPRLNLLRTSKAWMPGTRPGITPNFFTLPYLVDPPARRTARARR